MIAIGVARLPRAAGDGYSGALLIELTFDASGRVADVTSVLPLPLYNALLRQMLVGRTLAEVRAATDQLLSQLRGPLAKPTAAAIACAVANALSL